MTLRALSIAATGGRALMGKIDTISNNLANVNTVAFKKTRANFSDLFYQQIQRAGFGEPGLNQHPTGIAYGTGVQLSSTEKLFRQGSLEQTERQLDVAIDGQGFFRVTLPDNTIGYTRAGNFKIDALTDSIDSIDGTLDAKVLAPHAVTTKVKVQPSQAGDALKIKIADSTPTQYAGRLRFTYLKGCAPGVHLGVPNAGRFWIGN